MVAPQSRDTRIMEGLIDISVWKDDNYDYYHVFNININIILPILNLYYFLNMCPWLNKGYALANIFNTDTL